MSANKYNVVVKFSLMMLWGLAFAPAHSAIISYTNTAAYDTAVSWGGVFSRL